MLIRDKHIDPAAGVVINPRSIRVNPAISLTNAVIALIKARNYAERVIAFSAYCRAKAGTVSLTAAISGSDGLLVGTTLAIDAVAEKFKTVTTTAVYLSSGVVKTKAPATAIVFSAAHTINTGAAVGSFWGAILVQVDAAGTVTTKVSSADQVFTTRAAAIAALPAADATKVALSYIVINANDDSAWTANTDDMTDASDVATAEFISYVARTPLAAAVTPLALEEVQATLDTVQSEVQAELDEYIAILATTDGSGALTDGVVHLDTRAGRVYRGEA